MAENESANKTPIAIRYTFAKSQGVLVINIHDEFADVVYRTDASPFAIQELRRRMQKPLHLQAVTEEAFLNLLSKHYETKSGVAVQLAENISEKMDLNQLMHDLPKTADLLESENDAPVISLLNALFSEAIKQKASDIHIETFENRMIVRFRIDGVLQPILELPNVLSPLVISRVKVMSRLNIAEKRLPQDGRITLKIADSPVDVRVSTIPASHGERVVLRLLNKKAVHLKLTELGMNEQLLNYTRDMITKPHGIILVTGPTGSGKTTSLYAMLTDLNVPGRNILTVEEPIEYDLPGIGQIQVNPKVQMSFARGLRAILRQDPNIIMVGEIRDLETAEIAVQASLTGHLVLSTLHTNTAIGAITRLHDMGIEPFLLSSSLIGVIAQRLIRLLCPYCKKPHTASKEESHFLELSAEQTPVIYTAKGCEQCNQTGYSGRTGIYEIMVIDAAIRDMIHDHSSESKIETYVRTKFPSIRNDGIMQILAGNTTIEEVIRATSE